MKIHSIILFVAIAWLSATSVVAQIYQDRPHNQTAPSIVPKGCLVSIPTSSAPPSDQILFNETVEIERLFGFNEFRIRVWRQGCHEPNRSALLINIEGTTGINRNQSPKPNVRIVDPSSLEEFPMELTIWELNQAWFYEELLGFLAGNERFPWGWTYVLESSNLDAMELYNDDLELLFIWGSPSRSFRFEVPAYDVSRDLPQTPLPVFHGRYSGHWVVDGLPSSGLLLQIGEVPGTDRNFVFAIWFTYIDGVPTWVVGNSDFEIGSNEINLDMTLFEGGEFFTQAGSFTQDDVVESPVGTMTIRANHCNEIEADVDFTEIGEGSANLTFNRLIRIAGYDCDQTQ